MASLRDISRKTGFSISVVSRVLNPRPDKNARVAPKTRQRVLAAAEKLGFRRNRSAEFLKRGQAPTLGVFLPIMPNRLIADLIIGISEAASEEGFPLSLSFGQSPEDYREFVDRTAGRPHCGLITYPYFSKPEIARVVERFLQTRGSLVLVNARAEAPGVSSVAMDDAEGGRLAAARLLERGCRRFAVFGRYEGRNQGFRRALRDASLEAEEVPADEAGLESLRQAVARRPARSPLGVFAVTDRSAFMVLGAFQRAVAAVGRDLLLVGYDDLDCAAWTTPALTTVRQPFDELGRISVRLAIEAIYGRPARLEKVLPRLVVRETA